MKSILTLHKLLNQIESHLPHANRSNSAVSKSNVAWHLDHALKVVIGISKQLHRSDISDYKPNINMFRTLCFTIGFIPRGRGKSPKIVLPPDIILIDDIMAQIEMARELIERLKPLPKQSNFKHFAFGHLNKSQTLRFIEIHTKHHLKIINDILN